MDCKNDQDLVLSIACTMISVFLLTQSGFGFLNLFMVLVGVYFISKLWRPQKLKTNEDFKVVIIGAGFSGICMGKKLNDIGVKYIILEKAKSLGGTWRENIYPGVACDIPSHFYSYSFFPNPNWSREYSTGREIFNYLNEAASHFGVTQNIKFGQNVARAEWIEQQGKWEITTENGEKLVANILIDGTGTLHVPNTPDFPDNDKFTGDSFHTAQWKKDFDPKGKSVGVIGTGASAVQAIPSLAKQGVKELVVFQRTACWSPPRKEVFYSERAQFVFRYIPFVEQLYRYYYFWRNELRFAIVFCLPRGVLSSAHEWLIGKVHEATKKNWYASQIKDEAAREKLTPKFPLGCKRITPSDDYLATFNEPFVKLITGKIEKFSKDGIITSDKNGNECKHELDVVVYATGFNVLKTVSPFPIFGISGRSMEEIHGDTPMAYLGCTHPNLPNYFHLYGPGSNLGHSSLIYMIECQADYALDAITKIVTRKAKSIRVTETAMAKYWDWMQKETEQVVYGPSSPVQGWYRNVKNVNWTSYPASLVRYWWTTRSVSLLDYHITY